MPPAKKFLAGPKRSGDKTSSKASTAAKAKGHTVDQTLAARVASNLRDEVSDPDDPDAVPDTREDSFSFNSSDDLTSPTKSPPAKKRKEDKKKYQETEFSFSDFSDTSSDEALPPSPPKKVSSKNEEKSSKPDEVPVDELPVTFNQYYKHKCKLSQLQATRTISGQDICLPNRPAELPLDKLKLHYVVHYLHSGIWDHIVPPEDASTEGRIDFYLCNLCQKKFKNHLEKKEYPGRGSVLCHLATDHGLLVEAMRAEKQVNLEHDIRILAHNDKQFKESFDFGPETLKIPVEKLVTPKESMYWRMNKNKTASATTTTGSNSAATATTTTTTSSIQTITPTPTKPADTAAVKSTKRPTILECPHCDELKGNSDAPNLRLHIFHHYKNHWAERIERLSKGEKSFFCDRCPKKKKITGATLEGTRTAAVCHFAIQHYELRDVLEKDSRLSKQFVADLYWDHDNPNHANSTYFQAQSKAIENQATTTPLAARSKKTNKPAASDSEDSDVESDIDTSDISSFDISSSDESDNVSKSEKKKKSGNRRAKVMPGEENPNYIRKRGKINLSLDSDDGDSASDHSWEKNSSRKKKKTRKGRSTDSNHDEDDDQQRKERVLPRRSVANQRKNYSFGDDDLDDDNTEF